jgi:hypothetical protein
MLAVVSKSQREKQKHSNDIHHSHPAAMVLASAQMVKHLNHAEIPSDSVLIS